MKHVMTTAKTLITAVSLCAVLLFFGLPVKAEFTYNRIEARVPFTCAGIDSAIENEYEIVIEKLDEASPSPDSIVKTISDAGEGTFVIGIDEPGTYQYKVYEKAGTNSKIIYDDTAYTVTLFVTSDTNGELSCQIVLSKGGLAKPTEIAFANKAEKIDKPITPTKPVTPTVSTGEPASPYIPYAIAALTAGVLILILALRRRKEDCND